jgi:hypothetical protein
MNTIEHAWTFLIEVRKIPSFATSEERLNTGGWMIASIGGTNRDADLITASNHYTAADMLKEVDPDYAAHDWITCSHWAVGWVQHLIVDPTNEAVLRAVGEIGCALADYPILNELRYSEMELEWHSGGRCGEGCSYCEYEREARRDVEPGCYGDGALGHQHTRERCADLLESMGYRGTLPAELRGEMSDDASEEFEACEWLEENAPHPTASWGWHDGDFGLWESEEDFDLSDAD